MENIFVINGPNLNMLGKRDSDLYGDMDLEQLEAYTQDRLKRLGPSLSLKWVQSNHEGELVEYIHSLTKKGSNRTWDGLIINPAAYGHTSVAIHDALEILDIPSVEVHLSQVLAREQYRKTLLTAEKANMIMIGSGINSYWLAAAALCQMR